MAHLKNLEDFKKNLAELDKSLVDDSVEPSKDLNLAESWIDYVQRGDATAEQAAFVAKEWVPKLVKSLLTRKYDWNRTTYTTVVTFFGRLTVFLTENLGGDNEVLNAALRDLLDPNQPFYTKYCALQNDPPEDMPQLIDVPEFPNVDSLAPGDYIDCQRKNGTWEMVPIESFSDYRTEFQIIWPDDTKEWLSTDRDRARMATFGSRANLPPPPTTSAAHVTKASAPSQPQHAGVLDVTDETWKTELEVGSLLDARDTAQVWYQACIMELKTVTVVTGPFSAPASTGASAATNVTQGGMVQSTSMDDLYESNLADSTMSTASVSVVSVNTSEMSGAGKESGAGSVIESEGAMVVDGNTIDFTQEETEVPAQTGSSQSRSASPAAAPVDTTASGPTSVTKTVARIAFLGLPERLDEWIELSSDRLQKINSCSFGRRGKLVGVRDEIVFLAKLVPSPQGEIGKFAIFREGCFAQPLFIQLVNVFGAHHGFEIIEAKLQAAMAKINGAVAGSTEVPAVAAAEDTASADKAKLVVTPAATLTGLLNLVTAVGNMHRVLTKSFLAEFGPPFLDHARAVLQELSLAHIRETPVESLESALNALEQIALAHYGYNAASGRLLDPLKLEVALQHLRCPFLNRRLGGLKILSELVRRGENSRDCPSGLKITRSMANNVEEVSYRVMPVLFHFTLRSLCEQLRHCDAIVQIFQGENAHESLMSRASALISAMASQQCLENNLLQAMWTAGFVENKPEALQCLSNVMTGLPLQDTHVQFVLNSLRALEPSALSRSVVDIVTALALRCRDYLMSGGLLASDEAEACYAVVEQVTLFDDLSSASSTMDVVQEEGSAPPESPVGPPTAALLRSVFRIHTQTLLLLWDWTADLSGASDEVVTACLDKIELIVRPGKTTFDALKEPTFPWTMQWFRCCELVELAVERIRQPGSLFPAVKALQVTLNAWPVNNQSVQPGMKDLPFGIASKGELAVYLENEFHIVEAITKATLHLKESFNAQFLLAAQAAEWGADITAVLDVSNKVVLSQDVEDKLCALKLSASARQSYLAQLSQLMDFLHVFVRCSNVLEIPRETIFSLWRALVLTPVTSEEAEVAINFFHRIVNKTTEGTTAGSSTSTGTSTTAETSTTTAESAPRSAVSSRDVVLAAFTELLCDRQTFLKFRFFSTKSLQCVEKWFRWLNSDLSFANGLDGSSVKAVSFSATNDSTKLIGVDVFPDIVLMCHADKVAAQAVSFITTLPTTLVHWTRNADSAVAFRKMLLARCMAELSANVTQSASSGNVRLSRALLFLDGILEESLSHNDGAVALHGTLGRGNPITFHVTSPTKALKEFEGEVVLHANETVNALFDAVAQRMHLSIAEVKLFRLGNELSRKNEGGKLISQLRTAGEKERLLVTKHPLPKNSSSAEGESSAASNAAVAEGNVNENANILRVASIDDAASSQPVLVLSHTPEYFDLLFTLMHTSQGETCDRLWGLVTRIPTSTAVLQRWLELDGSNAASILLEYGANKVGKLSTLLYHLQVVELLLQPAVSAEELSAQMKFIQDIDHALLHSWVERFVQKNGLGCLLQAFDWVQKALNYSLLSPTGELPGVTANLLQQAAALIAKLLRAFYVRLAARPSAAHALTVGKAIHNRKHKETSAAITSTSTTSTSTTTSTTPSEASAAITVPPATEADRAVLALVEEWGWRIDPCMDQLVVSFSPPGLSEDAVVTLMVLVRKLAEHAAFNCLASADTATRTAKSAKRDAITLSLDSLLLIWVAVSLLSMNAPKTPKRRSVDSRRIVKELILGDASDLLPDTTSTAPDWFGIGSEWFVDAVGAYIVWLSAHDVSSSEENSPSVAGRNIDRFTTELLLAVLELRPPLVTLEESTSGASTTASTSMVSKKPLFLLAAALLDGPCARSLSIPSEVCTTASAQIMTELETVGKELKAAALAEPATGPRGVSAYPHLEGTVMLFVALSCREAAVMELLGTSNNLDFILYDCLGLVAMSECKQPIICAEERTRKHTYHLLKELVGRNATHANTVYRALAALHNELPAPSATTWDYRPQRENRSATGYVGLRNLGSTCYMNSLLQVLYMNTAVREYLLNELVYETETEEELRNNVAFQLKKVFYGLKHSEKRFFSPTDWTFAFKDETGTQPMNVMLQQDAQEFLQSLSERFERSIQEKQHATQNQTGATLPVDILHRTFGGQLCNQMFKSKTTSASNDNSASSSPVPQEIREQNEGFVCISLEVKGCVNLERSLAKFVEGEQIGGYLWEEGQPRETITKRQCIAQLSDTLIFHLKRFELNFDTFRREKVNDAFAFPLRLNMRRYTKEGLSEIEGRVNERTSGAQPNAEEDCEYELSGVVVHTGTTESGHYFAYIKEPTSGAADSTTTTTASSRWCEFNDSEVTPFSPALLEAETFGGKTLAHDLYSGGASVVTTEIVNPKSAYMLIYNRVPRTSAAGGQLSLSPLADASPLVLQNKLQGPVMQKFTDQLELENAQHRLSIRVLNEHHLAFENQLMEALYTHAAATHSALSSEQLCAYVRFVTQYLAHTAHSSVMKDACAGICKYLAAHKAHVSLTNGPSSTPASPTFTRAPTASSEHNKENDVPTQTSAASSSALEQVPPPPSDLILSEWLSNMDNMLTGLYAPKEETRKAIAEIVLKVIDLASAQHGKAPFSSPDVDTSVGLLSTSFGAALLTVAALAAQATATFKPITKDVYTIPEDTEIGEAEPLDEDAELLLAIKMSQELSSGPGIAVDVPAVAEIEAVVDAADVSPVPAVAVLADANTDTVAPPPPAPASSPNALVKSGVDKSSALGVSCCAPANTAAVSVPPAPLVVLPAGPLLAPTFLVALTNDQRMQSIGEHWRRSQAVLWLLLEIARLGGAQKTLLLKREVVAHLVDTLLGDQCPLNGAIYASGSRRRAPSSYVTVVPGKDGTLPFVARNVPDWTHLIELLAVLVCHSNSLALGQSMGEMSLQCVQTKTLYSTIFRQARYVTPAIPMIVHLCYENKQFSDLIVEALSEEM
eukprot:gene8041-9580_t